MQTANRSMDLPRGRGSFGPLLLEHDVFFGQLQSTRSTAGLTLSHRIANSPPEDVEVHTHLEAHFVLVTSGRYVSSAKAIPSRNATLIYNPAGTTHRDHFEQGIGSFFTICVSRSQLSESSDTELQEAVHLIDERPCGLAKALLLECARWDASSPLKAQSLYLELQAGLSYKSAFMKRRPSWLDNACELIQDSHKENLDVGQIARAVGVHSTHLARTFRNFLGCTPGDLLRSRRLEFAAELLLHSNLSLAEIALESGFSDQAQFTKSFCRVYGAPPGVYRRLTLRVSRRRDVAF
jgi:AraC family transcriptional regulator